MAVCTNKQEHLAIDLLKKIGIYDFFEYVAGHNTFDYCKPDPRHLTTIVEILDGDFPHLPRGCDAQAWGASEVARVVHKLSEKCGMGDK